MALVGRSQVYTEIVPALLRALEQAVETEDDPRVICALVRSLGVAVDHPFDSSVVDVLTPLLAYEASEHREMVRATVALSLGLLGTGSTATLLALAWDTTEGRQLVDSRDVSVDARCAAVLGLGIADDPACVLPLIELVRKLKADGRDELRLRTSAIHALGMLRNHRAEVAGDFLLEMLAVRRLDSVVRSAIPTALARLGRADAVPQLVALVKQPFLEPCVRQSAVIGLGRLADLEQPDVVRRLMSLIDDESGVATRHFAIMALARLGARDQEPWRHADAQRGIQEFLAQRLARPGRTTSRPWFGLATGIYLRHQPEGRERLAEPLLAAYDDVKNPRDRAAFALGLGLGGVGRAAPRLAEDFSTAQADRFRGCAALALGWLGHRPSADAILDEIADGRRQFGFLQLAQGLRLMGDTRLTATVTTHYARSVEAQWRSTRAASVAVLREGSAVPFLVRAMTHETLDAIGRGWACAAMERLAETELIPWHARLRRDSNFIVHALDKSLQMSTF